MSAENTKHQASNSGYEHKDVSVKSTVLIGVAIVVVMAISIVFLNEYYISVDESRVSDVISKPQSTTLKELRAEEDETLSSYKLLDSATATYQIPIDRAMELVAEEANAGTGK